MSQQLAAVGLAALLSAPAFKQQSAAPKCYRACLQKWVDHYLLAMRDVR
jgi:hypothetical protein